MEKRMSALEYQKQQLINQGIEQGRFELALNLRDVFSIEELVARTGFSREELESGKLNSSNI